MDGWIEGLLEWKIDKLMEGWMELGRMKEERIGELLTSPNYSVWRECMSPPLYSLPSTLSQQLQKPPAYMPYKPLSQVEKGLAGSSGPGAEKCLKSVGKDPHPPLRLSSHPGNHGCTLGRGRPARPLR